jgi:hypothetical protein
VAHYNAHERPFLWTATADSIFDKLQRICRLFNGHNTSVLSLKNVYKIEQLNRGFGQRFWSR